MPSDPQHRPSEEAHEPETPPPSLGSRSGMDQIARYSELALILPAGLAGGWIVGAYLDGKFHTHWIYLAGLVVGFIGGFTQIIRIAMKNSK